MVAGGLGGGGLGGEGGGGLGGKGGGGWNEHEISCSLTLLILVNVSKLPVALDVTSRMHRSEMDDSASPLKPSVVTPRSRSDMLFIFDV